ncbi:hypothetical protein BJX76DRAFT_267811 [Aspergillus varians]
MVSRSPLPLMDGRDSPRPFCPSGKPQGPSPAHRAPPMLDPISIPVLVSDKKNLEITSCVGDAVVVVTVILHQGSILYGVFAPERHSQT